MTPVVAQVATVLPQVASVGSAGPLIVTELARVAARFHAVAGVPVLPDLGAILSDLSTVGAPLASVLTDFAAILPDVPTVRTGRVARERRE